MLGSVARVQVLTPALLTPAELQQGAVMHESCRLTHVRFLRIDILFWKWDYYALRK